MNTDEMVAHFDHRTLMEIFDFLHIRLPRSTRRVLVLRVVIDTGVRQLTAEEEIDHSRFDLDEYEPEKHFAVGCRTIAPRALGLLLNETRARWHQVRPLRTRSTTLT